MLYVDYKSQEALLVAWYEQAKTESAASLMQGDDPDARFAAAFGACGGTGSNTLTPAHRWSLSGNTTKLPTDAGIDSAMAGIICRDGTRTRIRAVIAEAARTLA